MAIMIVVTKQSSKKDKSKKVVFGLFLAVLAGLLLSINPLGVVAMAAAASNSSSNSAYQLKLYVKITDKSAGNSLQGVTVSYRDEQVANFATANNNNNGGSSTGSTPTLTPQQAQIEKNLANGEITAATNLQDPNGLYVLNLPNASSQGILSLSLALATNSASSGSLKRTSSNNTTVSLADGDTLNGTTLTYNKVFGWTGPQGIHNVLFNFSYVSPLSSSNSSSSSYSNSGFSNSSDSSGSGSNATPTGFVLNTAYEVDSQMQPVSGSNVQLGPGATLSNSVNNTNNAKTASTSTNSSSGDFGSIIWLGLAAIFFVKLLLNGFGEVKFQTISMANLVPATSTPVVTQEVPMQTPTAPTAPTSSDGSNSNPNPSTRVARRSMPNRANQASEATVTNTATTDNDNNNNSQPSANNPATRQRTRPNRNLSPRSEVRAGSQQASNNGNSNDGGEA